MTGETRFTFRAEPSLAKAMREFCQFEELRPSQVMRKALKDYLATKSAAAVRPKKAPAK